MHGTQELSATSFLGVTLVPIIDLDVIQFAAETVTAATSAPAPDPCRSLAPTDPTAQDVSTSSTCWLSSWSRAKADELRGHQYTWTPVDIVSTRFCAAASAAVRSRVAAASGTVGASLCARSGSSRRLALMRSIVARSRSRCSAFSSSSEPGCLWLLVVAAAPAAPVRQLSQTGRACRGGILLCSACTPCTHGRQSVLLLGSSWICHSAHTSVSCRTCSTAHAT